MRFIPENDQRRVARISIEDMLFHPGLVCVVFDKEEWEQLPFPFSVGKYLGDTSKSGLPKSYQRNMADNKQRLKDRLGITGERIAMVQDGRDGLEGTMRHEIMHDVFACLPHGVKKDLLHTIGEAKRNFRFRFGYNRIREMSMGSGHPMVGLNEFLAYYFGNRLRPDRFVMPERVAEKLVEIGYKI